MDPIPLLKKLYEDLALEAKTKLQAVILKVCTWIWEIEEVNEVLTNTIDNICDLLDLYTEGKQISRLQESIPILK